MIATEQDKTFKSCGVSGFRVLLLIFIFLIPFSSVADPLILMLEERAKSGDANSQYLLGKYRQKNGGVFRNTPESLDWFEAANADGHILAGVELAYASLMGDGVLKDQKRSFRILQGLASKGYANAYNSLGIYYSRGLGVDVDMVESFESYRKGEELGSPRAIFNLSLMYKEGKGVEKNEKLSAHYLQKAANLEDEWALFNLANNSADTFESAIWLKKAGDKGLPRAQYELGHRYFIGKGVKEDRFESYIWLSLSKYLGYENANAYVEQVKAYLQEAELAEANTEIRRRFDSMLIYDVFLIPLCRFGCSNQQLLLMSELL